MGSDRGCDGEEREDGESVEDVPSRLFASKVLKHYSNGDVLRSVIRLFLSVKSKEREK